jgi:hypothetical protein
MLMGCVQEEIPPVPTPRPTIETETPEFQMLETDVFSQSALVARIVILETATAIVGKSKEKDATE